MILQLIPLLGAFPSATNLETPPPPALQAEPVNQRESRGNFTIDVFHENYKVDNLEVDSVNFPDSARRRTGVRLGFGPSNVNGYVEVASDRLDFEAPFLSMNPNGEGFTLGGGVKGIAHAGKVILDYGAGLNFAGGEVESSFENEDYFYAEFQARFAIGADINGWQPKGGIYLSSLAGTLEGQQSGASYDLQAANTGLFAEVGYNRPDKLVSGSLRVFMIGDVQGLALSLGFRP